MIDAKKNIAAHNKMRNHLNEHVETFITYYAYMQVNCAWVIYDENCQMGNMYALKRQSCFCTISYLAQNATTWHPTNIV